MSVVLGLFLCAVLPMINAACFTVGHKFCQDTTDKTWHPTGSVWRNSKCLDCNCSSESMSCCDAFGRSSTCKRSARSLKPNKFENSCHGEDFRLQCYLVGSKTGDFGL
uniref:Beta-microseminoprotein-like n=1 Tax=Cyprinus carpio carpio TaxID=630221 RepID=A0A9J8C4T4_CYPCA